MSKKLEIYFGSVIWFNAKKGWGFIEWEKDGVKQSDMFCHFSDISIDGFKSLKADEKVYFSIGLNKAGREKAINVQIIR